MTFDNHANFDYTVTVLNSQQAVLTRSPLQPADGVLTGQPDDVDILQKD